MEKQIGKLYVSEHKELRDNKKIIYKLVILCTGLSDSSRRFEGVVLQQTDDYSDHRVGNYSKSWTWNIDMWKEYNGEVILNNNKWTEHIDFGSC